MLAIVINELRAGGAFVGRSRRALRAAAAARRAGLEPPTLDEVRAARAVGRKIELLFMLVTDRLRRRHRGLMNPGLTHRELAAAATDLAPDARESLGRIATAAERVTYAGRPPGETETDALVARGEALLRALEAERSGPA